MSVDTLYNYSTATTSLTREHYVSFGSTAAQLGTYKRAFLGSTNFEIWDSSSGGSSMVEGVNYTLSGEDTRLTALMGSTVYTLLTMLDHTSTDIYITYKAVGSYTDATAMNDALLYLVPTGAITMYASTTAPTGWLYCDGTVYLRSDYSALYSVISSAYGGTSTLNFAVPDMRGRFAKGVGTSTGTSASGTNYASTLAGYYDDHVAAHGHDYVFKSSVATQNLNSTNYAAYSAAGASGLGSASTWDTISRNIISAVSSANMTYTPRSSLTTEPQSVGVGYIIKY